MPDETTSNPEPVNTAIPQALETLNSTTVEAVVAPVPVEAPVESILAPDPTPEAPMAQMGGNEPIAPASAPETPAVTPNPVPIETIAPEVAQPAPVEPVVEAISAQTPIEATTPTETTPAPVEVTVAPPVATPAPTQTIAKSMRELFAKAQSAIQFRKRKKLDRAMSLFAKQAKITNDEVEKLLHVSDATATRYLSTLEKEGKIKQNGKIGHAVSYSKI